jgi:hypothetical protein
LNASDALCFEYALALRPGEDVLELLATIWSSLQEQSQGMDFADPDQLSMEAALQSNEQDTLQEHLQELHALQVLADSDPELGALLSIDDVDGVGVFEPDDESWFVGVRPSLREGSLTLSLALELIPEGEQAGGFMRGALRLARTCGRRARREPALPASRSPELVCMAGAGYRAAGLRGRWRCA